MKKLVKSTDEDLSEGLPTPEHIDEANDIPDGIYFKNKKTTKVNEINRKKNTNRPKSNRNKN